MWQLGLAIDKIYYWTEAISTTMLSLTEVHSVIHLNTDLFSKKKKSEQATSSVTTNL